MRNCCCGVNPPNTLCECACSFLDESNRKKYVEKAPDCKLGDDECLSCGS